MFIVQIKDKLSSRPEWYDETIPLDTQADAERHVKFDREHGHYPSTRFDVRIVQVVRTYE